MDMLSLVSGALTISLIMAFAGVSLIVISAWGQRAVEIMPVALALASFAVGGYFIVSQNLAAKIFLWGSSDVYWIGLLAGSVIGILFGSVALLGGIPASFFAHLFYQVLVSR